MSPRGKAVLVAGLPLILLTPPLVWLGGSFARDLADEQRARTAQTLELHAGALQRSIDRIEGKLESLAVFVAGQTAGGRAVDAEQFRTFAAGLHASATWIRAFQIVSDGVITQTYPLQGNEAVLGYNLLTDPRPVIGSDVVRAERTGRVTITGPLDLIQGGLGIIVRRPLPHADRGPALLVAVVLNIAPLLEDAGIAPGGAEGVQFAIRHETGEAFFGSAAVFGPQPVVHRLALPDGWWELGARPQAGWTGSFRGPVLRFYLAGAVIILLLGLLVYVLAASRGLLTETVRERTAALRLELSARQQAEEALRASESRYQTLAEVSPVGIFRTDARGVITYVNPRWSEISGLPAAEAMGEGWLRAVHPEDRGKLAQGWQSAAGERRTLVAEYRFVRSDGSVAWVMGHAVPERDAAGRIVGYVGTITDVTDKKRAEEEIRQFAAALEQRVEERTAELAVARDRAEAADRLKSSFLATMSHELRTQLNSIIGFTGVILQGLAGPLQPEQRKQLEMVQGSARHLLALINDVLDISKIEAGQLVIANEPFDLCGSIRKTIDVVRPMAEAKGLAIRVKLTPDLGAWKGDQRRVEQVLLNLLNNAVKFTERGEVGLAVTLVASAADLPVRATAPPGSTPPFAADTLGPILRLAVRDTGIGIKPEHRAILFRPFQQIDTGLTRQHEGTGLGLAICRRLATLMGGTIEVESEWGKGSVFTVTLPFGVPGARRSGPRGRDQPRSQTDGSAPAS